jgi:hypothetical protein
VRRFARECHPAEGVEERDGARQHHRRVHQKPCGAARHHSPTSGKSVKLADF